MSEPHADRDHCVTVAITITYVYRDYCFAEPHTYRDCHRFAYAYRDRFAYAYRDGDLENNH